MDAREISELLKQVKNGRVSRRSFVEAIVGSGLGVPSAVQLLRKAGIAYGQPTNGGFTPTKRGGAGMLRLLWWQAPTLLNPHNAVGIKDLDGSRIFYEPLAAYDPDANLFPVLATAIPSAQNGAVAKDGKSVTWRLKKGVVWHDGKPFTADDVVFNWEYAADPATAATTIGSYENIQRIDKLDAHTVKITFKTPQAFWADAFCGNRGTLIPKHLFDDYRGRHGSPERSERRSCTRR